ncbi:hypothetical protein GCM10010470_02160 [Saccharopolyspora taberi]|uniref:UbiC transcription regulator-associated domain-containing protein n=1 Tax=Saccharopolyspora taberi TaxID=60895 RepID=A0ABN3V0L9_9PSEU
MSLYRYGDKAEKGETVSEQLGGWVEASTQYLTPRSGAHGDTWAGEASKHGQSGTQVLREVAELAPPLEVTEALGLAEGELAVVRRRTMLLNNTPVELTDSYYPTPVAGGTALAEHRKIPGGAVALLAERGFTAAKAVEDVTARPATPDEADALQLPPGAFVLVLDRTSYTADGTPFESAHMVMNPVGRRLRYEITMG